MNKRTSISDIYSSSLVINSKELDRAYKKLDKDQLDYFNSFSNHIITCVNAASATNLFTTGCAKARFEAVHAGLEVPKSEKFLNLVPLFAELVVSPSPTPSIFILKPTATDPIA